MKTICKLSFLFLALTWTACQKEANEETDPDKIRTIFGDVTIVNGTIQSPKWLIQKVDSVANTYMLDEFGRKIYPSVYGVEHGGQNYIYVLDLLESCGACGNMYFTLSGDPIDPMSGLYGELDEAKVMDDYTLLWR
jgi:hypothetical protein